MLYRIVERRTFTSCLLVKRKIPKIPTFLFQTSANFVFREALPSYFSVRNAFADL
ncbi:hypothetical protein Mapa_002017 [Marchantia paleacea]|nr:hypothetical protein Mapa_002017 [Marchantia paleacea]